MFLLDYILILSAISGICTGVFSNVTWYLKVLIGIGSAVGSFIALLIIALLYAYVSTFFFKNEEEVVGKAKPYYKWMVENYCDAILRVARIKVEIEGAEKVPDGKRFLLVANHQSNFDPILFMVKFRKHDIAFISKPSNLRIPIAGPYIKKCKFLSIDRESPMKSLKTLGVAANYIKNDEASVGIFPEGTRSKSGQLQKFHDGIFMVAKNTKSPIVVATIRDTNKITKNFPFKKTVVKVNIVKVVEPEEYEQMRTTAISNYVREYVESDLGGYPNELEAETC